MKDYEEAYNTINNLKAFDKSPFLTATIENAEAILNRVSTEEENPNNKSIRYLGGSIDAIASYVSETYSGTLLTLGAEYHNMLYVKAYGIQGSGHSAFFPLNGALVEAGFDDTLFGFLRLKAGVGYFAFRVGFMTYSLGAGLSLPYLMSVQFDVEKTPLALYYPMEDQVWQLPILDIH